MSKVSQAQKALNIVCASLSCEGGRSVNEDCVFCAAEGASVGAGGGAPSGGAFGDTTERARGAAFGGSSESTASFFALADGLGGHGFGEEASQLVVAVAYEEFLGQVVRWQEGDLAECFQTAQDSLLAAQNARNLRSEMKTTLVVLSIVKGVAEWAHIGDSRLYCFCAGRLQTRTLDHSVPQMLVATGEIREKDIRHHPDRNRLLRVMGIEWQSPRYQLSEPLALAGGEAFLLCSDGFWEYVDERQMQRLLRQATSPAHWLELMEAVSCKAAANKKNRDNYSAIAVWVE